MPDVAKPPPIANPSWGPSSLARTIVFGIAWLPFAAVISYFVPMFDPIFRKLEEGDHLPALTRGLAGFSRLNAALVDLPLLLCFTALVLADGGVLHLTRRMRRGELLYSVWYQGVILYAVAIMILSVYAMIKPIFHMNR